ncbi:MAG: hypothetical protein H0U27_00705 [Nitrosopumilus sp.]|nr:hypothetical protein [Nitrosopumilus sp.]
MIIPTGFKNIVQIAAECEHAFLIDTSGNIFAFGNNSEGQLGAGDTEDKNKPIIIPFFVERKKQLTRNLAEKWDIETLAQLAKDKASYSEICYSILKEKLPKETSSNQGNASTIGFFSTNETEDTPYETSESQKIGC